MSETRRRRVGTGSVIRTILRLARNAITGLSGFPQDRGGAQEFGNRPLRRAIIENEKPPRTRGGCGRRRLRRRATPAATVLVTTKPQTYCGAKPPAIGHLR